jgi:hypothetical protein
MNDIRERMHVFTRQLEFVLDIEPSGAGNQQMAFDAAQFAQRLEQPDAVDGARRSRDGDDETARRRGVFP